MERIREIQAHPVEVKRRSQASLVLEMSVVETDQILHRRQEGCPVETVCEPEDPLDSQENCGWNEHSLNLDETTGRYDLEWIVVGDDSN